MNRFDIGEKAMENLFRKFETLTPVWIDFVKISFLPPVVQQEFIELIQQKTVLWGWRHSTPRKGFSYPFGVDRVIQFAEVFPDKQIVASAMRQLS